MFEKKEQKTTEQATPAVETKEAVAEDKAVMSDEEKKAARKASAQKMIEHKKAATKTLVDFAKRQNFGDDPAVKEAAEYLSGEARKATGGASRISVLDQIFKDKNEVSAVDIFMNFEKGRAEMITLCKNAAKRGITIEYDEAKKVYIKK